MLVPYINAGLKTVKVYLVNLDRIVPGKAVFTLHDEKGFPLEMSALLAFERGLLIDWNGFCRCARRSGNFNMARLINRIYSACLDAGYTEDWFEKMCTELPAEFKLREPKHISKMKDKYVQSEAS